MDRWFVGKWIGGLAVNGALEIIYCPRVLVSTLRGRFNYVMLRFCGILLGFVGDYMISPLLC